jgi:GNAT superfamily N-acetyltransferase
VYVEHAFGFSQILGTPTPEFESELHQYLLVDKAFGPTKVRLYTPHDPAFLRDSKWDSLKSIRQRFTLEPERGMAEGPTEFPSDWAVEALDAGLEHVEEIERLFGVVERFWRSREDFVSKSWAVLVWCEGQMAAICYGAAEADHRVEIDVSTRPEFRERGLGKFAVNRFIQRCRVSSREPLWDCYTNNIGSMCLAQSLGFQAANPPYAFYTISK